MIVVRLGICLNKSCIRNTYWRVSRHFTITKTQSQQRYFIVRWHGAVVLASHWLMLIKQGSYWLTKCRRQYITHIEGQYLQKGFWTFLILLPNKTSCFFAFYWIGRQNFHLCFWSSSTTLCSGPIPKTPIPHLRPSQQSCLEKMFCSGHTKKGGKRRGSTVDKFAQVSPGLFSTGSE